MLRISVSSHIIMLLIQNGLVEGNQSDTRTYKTISEPKEILDKPNESTGAFIDRDTDLKLGFKYGERR